MPNFHKDKKFLLIHFCFCEMQTAKTISEELGCCHKTALRDMRELFEMRHEFTKWIIKYHQGSSGAGDVATITILPR